MKIAIITLFPEMFAAITGYGITSRAINNGLLDLRFCNPREFTEGIHQSVDDRPYGGGPGMVMKVQPLKDAIDAMKAWIEQVDGNKPRVVYLSPQGQMVKQAFLQRQVFDQQPLILIAGRYEGIDERLLDAEVDEEWSIGDYVLSGGELPAMVVLDGIIRLLPDALGHKASAQQDSFSEGLLDCPHYTRPEKYEGQAVPSVLLSGNHQHIERWRLQQSLGRTWQRRPDLLEHIELTPEQARLLAEFKVNESDR